jgi:hypothetical protein
MTHVVSAVAKRRAGLCDGMLADGECARSMAMFARSRDPQRRAWAGTSEDDAG